MSLSSARTESVNLRYTPMFLRMAVGNWTVVLCLKPLVLPCNFFFEGVPARADVLHVQLLAHDDADERDLAARSQVVLRFHIPARRL